MSLSVSHDQAEEHLSPFALPSFVVRRDGASSSFDLNRIRSAIARAGQATGAFGNNEADRLTHEAARTISVRFASRAPLNSVSAGSSGCPPATGRANSSRRFSARAARGRVAIVTTRISFRQTRKRISPERT